ncbi:MAG: hypothetical protein ACNI3H_06050 [Halarcobacter ebronensis]|uniref:hypothetical protein n=1 Tax=Halarcobacter ebronensis TaxID=1462615 RepID=UPI003C7140D7
MDDINIAQILENAINQNDTNLFKTEHILSGIDTSQALVLADNDKTLKIYTQDNDVLNLDLVQSDSSLEKGEWKQVSSNNEENFATYVSTVDNELKILVDETKVESLV